jgi:hypothetical protein
MRHTSLLGLPKSIPLLPPSVVFPAPIGLLVPAAGLPHRLTPRLSAARIRAVPLPAIAVRAHHHLASASVAAQQSSVVRGPAASPTERRARCESSSKALYSSGGARPPWRQRARFPTPFWARCPSFSQQRIIAQPALHPSCFKSNNRSRPLNDNYSCPSHKGRCRPAHDRSIRFSTSIDDAIQLHQTAG